MPSSGQQRTVPPADWPREPTATGAVALVTFIQGQWPWPSAVLRGGMELGTVPPALPGDRDSA